MVYLIIGLSIISCIGFLILKDEDSKFYFGFIILGLFILSFMFNFMSLAITSNIYHVTYDIETNKLVESSFMGETSHLFIVEDYKSYWTWKEKHKYKIYNHSEMFESKNIDDVKNYINKLDNENYEPKRW